MIVYHSIAVYIELLVKKHEGEESEQKKAP